MFSSIYLNRINLSVNRCISFFKNTMYIIGIILMNFFVNYLLKQFLSNFNILLQNQYNVREETDKNHNTNNTTVFY